VTTLTSRNVPILEASDAADIPARVNPLAQLFNDRPGVSALTTTQRNALTGAELWDGRVILNTTTDRLNRYDLGTTTWVAVADSSEVAALLATSGTPAADGTASRGVSAFAARADHIHPEPTYSTWSPTLVGFTVTNQLATYCAIGKFVHVNYRATIATASSVMYVPLPFSYARTLTAGTTTVVGTCYAGDISANGTAIGVAYLDTTARLGFTGPTGVWRADTSIPFAWAVGDTFAISAMYERA
jgi:hypothetical protein